MKLDSLQDLNILQNNSTHYTGKLPNYQKKGYSQGKKHKNYQQDTFSLYQNTLYKRALFGLSVFDEKEVKKMHWEKKRRIKRVHKRAQSSINIFKQERVNTLCSAIYNTIFPGEEAARVALSTEVIETDPNFINTLDLKSLGINKKAIAKRFVQEGILPKDFYELKKAV